MTQVVAKVYGAVSIVNAIAIGKGSTLGIDTFVETTLTKKEGKGIHITSENKTISSRLITLPTNTIVHPGHGPDTIIGEAEIEYKTFASKSHPEDLAGDVTWLGYRS